MRLKAEVEAAEARRARLGAAEGSGSGQADLRRGVALVGHDGTDSQLGTALRQSQTTPPHLPQQTFGSRSEARRARATRRGGAEAGALHPARGRHRLAPPLTGCPSLRGGYPLGALGSEDWCDAIHAGVTGYTYINYPNLSFIHTFVRTVGMEADATGFVVEDTLTLVRTFSSSSVIANPVSSPPPSGNVRKSHLHCPSTYF